MAIQRVKKIAIKNNLSNVKTIQSDCATGLPPDSVDVILLYDIFHGLAEPAKILKELYRVLKPNGWLSFSDHHMGESEIVNKFNEIGLFKLASKGKNTYKFTKI
jgi:SAM-dependent methyltransferase